MSSVILRGALQMSARADECEAITGAFVVLMAAQKVSSATCEISTIIPRRFISSTTSLPNGVSPSGLCGTPGLPSSPDEFAQSSEFDQVSVIYRTPSR